MKNVKVMWDGLNAWKGDGHPVDPPSASTGAGIGAPVGGVTLQAPVVGTAAPAPVAP